MGMIASANDGVRMMTAKQEDPMKWGELLEIFEQLTVDALLNILFHKISRIFALAESRCAY